MSTCRLPADSHDHLSIDNAAERFEEAQSLAPKIAAAGVPLGLNLDHTAIFADPPHLAGPLKRLGYLSGWDARCYLSRSTGC